MPGALSLWTMFSSCRQQHYPAALPSLSINCQSYANALTNVTNYKHLVLKLVSISEIDFDAPYCMIKMNRTCVGWYTFLGITGGAAKAGGIAKGVQRRCVGCLWLLPGDVTIR
eukprot:g24643.t1